MDLLRAKRQKVTDKMPYNFKLLNASFETHNSIDRESAIEIITQSVVKTKQFGAKCKWEYHEQYIRTCYKGCPIY